MSAAVHHILRQMQSDARLAWLIGPGSRTYELLIEEAASANSLDPAELQRQHEATLKFEPWPSDLQAEIDPQTVLLDSPEPKPLFWHEDRNKYSANGHIVWRNSVGRFAHYWEGFETRKAVLGGEEWNGSYHYYVPDNFGDLVEVPTP